MDNKKVSLCFVSIILIYWCTYQGTEGTKFLVDVDITIKHAVNFIFLLAVGIVGFIGCGFLREMWVKGLWTAVYLSVVGFVAIFGTLDLIVGLNSQNLRNFIGPFRLFFTSPVPFAIMLFLAKRVKTLN